MPLLVLASLVSLVRGCALNVYAFAWCVAIEDVHYIIVVVLVSLMTSHESMRLLTFFHHHPLRCQQWWSLLNVSLLSVCSGPCSTNFCHHGGQCIARARHGAFCSCPHGYIGVRCEGTGNLETLQCLGFYYWDRKKKCWTLFRPVGNRQRFGFSRKWWGYFCTCRWKQAMLVFLPILTTSPLHFFLKGWENVLFELGSERVNWFYRRRSL